MGARRDVLVVGGGVAGLACALYLSRAGAGVTVVESNRVGSGASSGNAGWLSPAQAGPLPEPGLIGGGLRMLLDRTSALYVAPRTLPALAPWLLRFATYCTPSAYAAGAKALSALGVRVFELVDELGLELELHRDGLLAVAPHERTARQFLESIRPMAQPGLEIPSELVSGPAVHSYEPALVERMRAGVSVPQHWHVRPEQFVAALADRVRGQGAEIIEGAEVQDIETSGTRISAVRTAAGVLEADQVLLAAGAWSPRVARMVGLKLPVAPGKGYSFTVRPQTPLRHAVLLLDVHVGCSPLNDGTVRVAGTMEFSGVNARLDRRRLEAIADGAEAALGPWLQAPAHPWTGLRPIAPDGLPIIDRAPQLENLWIATAYSMLGMTLSLPAAEQLSAFMASGRRPTLLEPFRADRFKANRGWSVR
ncbi:MAG TPA: FAD-dependent oxidoreductase [Solirubrobacteraceae bacterium]